MEGGVRRQIDRRNNGQVTANTYTTTSNTQTMDTCARVRVCVCVCVCVRARRHKAVDVEGFDAETSTYCRGSRSCRCIARRAVCRRRIYRPRNARAVSARTATAFMVSFIVVSSQRCRGRTQVTLSFCGPLNQILRCKTRIAIYAVFVRSHCAVTIKCGL